MKRYLLTFALGGLLLTTGLTSCLKDKGYDNGQYGVNGPASKAVSIPQATSSPIAFSVDAITTAQSINAPTVNLETPNVAAEDVTVTLVVDQSLLPNGVVPMPATAFNMTSLTLVIPAGSRTATAKINIPNASILNPNNKYGIGFKIASVSPAGYAIASNLKSVVISFSIKNKYDGVYNLRGYHNRNSPDYTIPYNVTVHMITTGPSSVVFFYPDPPGPDTYAHPINGNAGQYYGDFAPNITFDPATDLAIGVNEYVTNALPMNIVAGSNSRFEPGPPKKMYLLFRYNNNDLRRFYDTLTYLSARP
jgi:hypothetical protein